MAKRIVLSDGTKVNTYGYKVNVAGIDLRRFTDNPVMLYMHDYQKVIGRWENFSLNESRLEADPVFDDGDELGANVKRKFENDFLRAASMGIIIRDMQEIDGIWTVTKSELLEASIVSVPSDSGAVVLYNQDREILSAEQFNELKLSFKHYSNQSNNMALELSQNTKDSLKLSGEITTKDVEIAVAEKDRTISDLKTQLKAQTEAQYASFLDAAEKDGKITAAEKKEFLTLSVAGGFESVKTIVEGRTDTTTVSLADQVRKSTLTAGRENWDYMKWMKEDSKGLQKLRAENPKEFERLQATLKK